MGIFSFFKKKKVNEVKIEENNEVKAESAPVAEKAPEQAPNVEEKVETKTEITVSEKIEKIAEAPTPAKATKTEKAAGEKVDKAAKAEKVPAAEKSDKSENTTEKTAKATKKSTKNTASALAEEKTEEKSELAATQASADETADKKITGRFEIKKSKDGRYVFNLYASNHVIVATSQIYSSSQSALIGINSVIANADKAPVEDTTLKSYETYGYPKWEIYLDKGEQYRFRLYATNGSCVCHSQGYTSKTNCKKGIESIIRSSRNAEIDKSYLKKEEN